MAKLEYTFTNDILFKMLFRDNTDLLKRLVSELLGIKVGSIGQFHVTNPEMPPEVIGEKFCRLDIAMTLDGQKVDLEIQVADRGDYPERSLYYWAREYSSALAEGEKYKDLPRTIVISILAFKLFDCKDFHSEFGALEVIRHDLLTDKMSLHYFELPKLPDVVESGNELNLWLKLFQAETEEDIKRIEALEVPVMRQAIEEYRRVTATSDFRELERLRSRARHDEASALGHARREEEKKWQGVVAEKDAQIAALKAKLGEDTKL